METVFKLKAKDLDKSFIDSVRNLFKDHEIEISIKQVQDETDYLLKSPENKRDLLEAINDIKKNKNLIRLTAQEFEELTEKLLNA
jgi:antitoxin YefM